MVAPRVVELSSDGEVVQEWPLTAVYDPVERPGTEMCVEPNPVAPPSWFYPDAAGVRDWTHGNAVVVDEEANWMLVSLRHLDAIVALRYHDDTEGPAGELLWELGPQGTLELAGEGDWPYHPHAPELQDDGTLLVYDNGNGRPGTGEGADPAYTRVVLYDIDEDAGTVTQVWEHRDTTADGKAVVRAVRRRCRPPGERQRAHQPRWAQRCGRHRVHPAARGGARPGARRQRGRDRLRPDRRRRRARLGFLPGRPVGVAVRHGQPRRVTPPEIPCTSPIELPHRTT